MWHNFIDLVRLIWSAWLTQMSSSTPAQVFGASVFVLTQVFKSLRNLSEDGQISWHKLKQFWRDHWRANVRDGALAVLVVGMVDAAWLTVNTVYVQHHDSVERWRTVVNEKDSLKEILKQRDKYILTLEHKKACPVCPAVSKPTSAVPPTPTIKSFPRELGTDKDGYFITELTLSSDVAILPPLTIELDFDVPIYSVDAKPSPMPAAMMGGGDRWQGTRGWVSIPNTGINPNLLWIVNVKSRSKAHLINPPKMQVGY